MPYAEGRIYNDADAHIMEPANWLASYADAKTRALLKPLDLTTAGKLAERASIGKFDASHWNEVEIEKNLMSIKGWEALGAFDPVERMRALDLLGFNRQLVFISLAMGQFWGVYEQHETNPDLIYGGARAVNRAITDFCRAYRRMIAVGFLPLDDPRRAEREIDEGLKLGCGAYWIPAQPAGGKSPTHHDFDGVWGRLQDANVPFMLHVGAGATPMPDAYRNNGRGPIIGFAGGEGGETLDSKAFMMLHASAEAFLSAMILDGTLEQFPRLRGGVIELGALWVVPWLKRLDVAQNAFARTEPGLALPTLAERACRAQRAGESASRVKLLNKASDYVRRQLKFTPFPTEPAGWIIEQAGEELFMFSSDYPHIEGGRNPLKRFEESMTSISESAKERFYATNFTELMGG